MREEDTIRALDGYFEQDFEPISLRDAMDRFKIYIPYVKEYGVTPQLIEQVIQDHRQAKKQMTLFKKDYEGLKEGVAILRRQLKTSSGNPIESMINNKLNNAFSSEIVDTLNGYFLGLPINYVVAKDGEEENPLHQVISDMRTRDNLPDKDATLGKRADISGYGARAVYLDIENGKPVTRIKNLKSEETILFYEESMSNPRYALHYYNTAIVNEDATSTPVVMADFYDELNVYTFIDDGEGFVAHNIRMHGASYTPVFGMENNDELSAAIQKVLNLKNAYDREMSDASNEIEASRLAILILENLNIDKEDIEKMKASGVLEMWGENMNARYLTKDVNDNMIENALDRKGRNIVRFAKSIDFTDKDFMGDLSGIAILFKTMSLEQKAIIAENKMRSTLQYQMKVLCSIWAKMGICKPEDYLKIWFGFKRNLPKNVKELAETVNILDGKVSRRTLLSLLPFIDDVEEEIKQLEVEKDMFEDPIEIIDETKEELEDLEDVIDDEEKLLE